MKRQERFEALLAPAMSDPELGRYLMHIISHDAAEREQSKEASFRKVSDDAFLAIERRYWAMEKREQAG